MSNQSNQHNNESKADIIRLIREEKQSITKVANDFGVNDQTIRNWLKAEDEKKIPENNRIAELEAQLREEKKKTTDLQQTVDILKKSVDIFVQDNRK
ncbi:MAG TPA: transposase [Pseudobacteroides sp.]|uniref:transposase n=1 Tax=Pseudobacteroides sp. TaxID=1968840 RepID=UPI002F937ADD